MGRIAGLAFCLIVLTGMYVKVEHDGMEDPWPSVVWNKPGGLF